MFARYRKWTDHSHNSSTYHKKDGTAVRAKLKALALKEALEAEKETSEEGAASYY